MMSSLWWPLVLSVLSVGAIAVPEVQLGNTKVVGRSIDTLKQEFFGGIPHAEPPVGALRFQPPQPKSQLAVESFDASRYGKGCLQAEGVLEQESEDCLTINIYRPAGVNSTSKLPVMVWTYGGGFRNGNSSAYNASGIVAKSVQRGSPIVYVSYNYRLAIMGFPQGQEATAQGVLNLGLRDEVAALTWIQHNIEAFGGDKKKVTVAGDTSGSIMNAILMLKPDFNKWARGAILSSGSAASIPELPGPDREPYWQSFTAAVPSCASSASSNQTLDCLRKANTSEITTAFFATLQAVGQNFVFNPSLDGPGGFLPDLVSKTLASGNYARIPFISGTVLDEGTVFTPSSGPLDDNFFRQLFITRIPPRVDAATINATIDKLLQLYPDNPALGSPFGSGNGTFGLPPGYKRIAALQGDIIFQSQRRALTQMTSRSGLKVWAYLFSQPNPNAPPANGVYHSSEIPYVYGVPTDRSNSAISLSGAMTDYWLSFVTSLNPNDGKGSNRPDWPQYTPQNEAVLQLKANETVSIPDTYRQEQIDFINSNPPAFRH